MSLKHSYSLIAPFYDAFLAPITTDARRRSLAPLADRPAGWILLGGVGTGLDLPHLPAHHRYVGIDLTRAMLARSLPRARDLDLAAVQGDMQRLPFADASFDAVVLHLILAVVPSPEACLGETARVLRPGGCVLVYDKFLKPGEAGGWRRWANPLSRRIATRLDVVLEDAVARVPELEIVADAPVRPGGWFRLATLRKR